MCVHACYLCVHVWAIITLDIQTATIFVPILERDTCAQKLAKLVKVRAAVLCTHECIRRSARERANARVCAPYRCNTCRSHRSGREQHRGCQTCSVRSQCRGPSSRWLGQPRDRAHERTARWREWDWRPSDIEASPCPTCRVPDLHGIVDRPGVWSRVRHRIASHYGDRASSLE